MRLLRRHVSLTTKYVGLVVAAFVLPTSFYLIYDVVYLRDALLKIQIDALMRTAEIVSSQIDIQQPGFDSRLQEVLQRNARCHPDLDILVVDQGANVVAATQHSRVGQRWHEEGIRRVLDGISPSAWAVMQHEGSDVLDVTVPVTDQQGRVALVIHMARALESIEAEIGNFSWRHILFFFVTTVLTIIILAAGTYWLVLRRLRMLDAALRVPALKRRLPSPTGHPDEIDTLAAALARLVDELNASAENLQESLREKETYLEETQRFNERLESEVAKVRNELSGAQQRLIHAEHLSTIGQLAAGLAHEVRNPLFIIQSYAAKIRNQVDSQKEVCDDIAEEVDRVNLIIKRLLELGQSIAIVPQEVSLRPILEKVLTSARQGLELSRSVNLQLDCPEDYRVHADPHLLRQAVANVVDNALNAIGEQGTVTIDVAELTESIIVTIIDDGPGIQSDDLKHVFEPFFSRTPGGTGLGLCSAKKIVEMHDAEIRIESESGKGSKVMITLAPWPRTE